MGWTETYKPEHQTMKQFLTAELESERVKILAMSAKGSTYYAAVELTDVEGKKDVMGLVILTGYNRKEGTVRYKDVDETMGPNETDCPGYILDMLSPTTSEWALEWRKKCREPKIPTTFTDGTIIKFSVPLTFTTGGKYDTFVKKTLVRRGRKTQIFHAVDISNGEPRILTGPLRISRLKHKIFTVAGSR